MNDPIALPAYPDETLAGFGLPELTDFLVENEGRVPRNVIDECAHRGEAMVGHLSALHENGSLWQPDAEYGEWSTTAALVIIARKIARTAWSIHHYKSVFDPERITKNA